MKRLFSKKQILKNSALGLVVLSSLVIFSNFVAPQFVQATINKQINYQGKLTNLSGVAVPDGTYNIRFKLYTASSGGSPLWTESWCKGTLCDGTGTDNRVTISNGLFSTMLGTITSLVGVDFNQTLYLGVEIGSSTASSTWDGEMTPRKIIGAVPAAFVADTLQGITPAGFFQASTSNATSTTSTYLSVTQTGAGKIAEFFGAGSASVFSALSTGKVGIGTTTPLSTLSVQGTAGTNPFTVASSTGTSLLTVLSNGSVGVGTSTTQSKFTVSNIDNLGSNVRGITSFVSGNDGSNYAGYFSAGSTATAAYIYGLYAEVGNVADANGAYGVYGNGGASWVGVYGTGLTGVQGASNSASGYGVYAGQSDPGGYALYSTGGKNYFSGNVGIGTTTPIATLNVKGSGSTVPFLVASSTGTSLFSINTSGAALFASNAGTSGQILQSVGSTGAPTWISTSTLGLLGSSTISNLSANYIPKWNTSSFGNSLIYDSGTTIGIGSTTPAALLGVNGSAYFGGNVTATGTLTVSGTGTSTVTGSFAVGGTGIFAAGGAHAFATGVAVGNGIINASGSGSVGFGYVQNAGASVNILSSGIGSLAGGANIGISVGGNIAASNSGAVALGYAVDGSITASNTGSFALGAATSGFSITSSGVSSFALGEALTGSVISSGEGAFAFGDNITASRKNAFAFGNGFTNSATSTFQIGFSSTPIFFANSTSTGIGTTSPFSTLSVQGISGSTTPFTVASSTGSSLFSINKFGAALFANAAGATGQILQSSGSTGAPTWISTSSLAILSTTTAASTYVPYSGATSDVNLNNKNLTNVGGIDSNGYISANSVGIYRAVLVGANLADEVGLENSQDEYIAVYQTANDSFQYGHTGDITINSSGYVGIGSTTPTQLLSVGNNFTVTSAGVANANNGFTVPNSSGFYIPGYDTNLTSNTLRLYGTNQVVGASNGDLSLGNSARVTILSGGNVGIGSTTPGSILSIKGTSGSQIPLLTIASSTNAALFSVLSSGNVGIGTSTPSAPLYVAGTSTNSTAIFFNPNTNTQVVIQTPIGTDGSVANSPFIVKNHLGQIVSAIREDGVLYGQTISTTDNITAAINQPAAIGLGNNIAGLDLNKTASIGWSNGTNYWDQVDTVFSRIATGTIAVGTTAQGTSNGTLIAGAIGIGSTTPGSILSIKGTSGSQIPLLTIASSTNAALFSVLSSGNVGVGTTTPLSIFSVQQATSTIATDIFSVVSTYGGQSINVNRYGNVGIGGPAFGINNYKFNVNSVNSDVNNGGLYVNGMVYFNSGNFTMSGNNYPDGFMTIDDSNRVIRFGDYGNDSQGTQVVIDDNLSTISAYAATSLSLTNGDNSALTVGTNVILSANGNTTIQSEGNTYIKDLSNTLVSVLSGGNVGIGTTTPTSKLDVFGSIGSTSITIGNNSINSSADTLSLVFRQGVSSGMAGTGGKIVSGRDGVYGGAGSTQISNLQFFTSSNGADTEKMRITNDGKIGIGTSTPVSKLDVYGGAGTTSIAISNSILNSSTDELAVLFRQGATSGGPGMGGRIVSGREGVYGGASVTQASNMQFFTAVNGADTEKMRITSAGNVGIGTTSPTTLLTVATTTGQAVLSVTSSGNVGINTTNPTSPLQVSKDGYNLLNVGYAGSYTTFSTNVPNAGFWFQNNLGFSDNTGFANLNSGGSITFKIGGGIAVSSVGGTAYAMFYPVTGASGGLALGAGYNAIVPPNNGMIVQGSVGIGTSSPISVLSVRGNSGSTTDVLSIASSTNTNLFSVSYVGSTTIPATGSFNITDAGSISRNASSEIRIDGGTTYFIVSSGGFRTNAAGILGQNNGTIIGLSDVGGSSRYVNFSNSNSDATGGILTATGSATDVGMTIRSKGAGALILNDNNTGNVGVGTTTPAQKLDVWGNMQVGTSTNSTTPTFFVNSATRRVGIGTSSPVATLNVKGTAGISPLIIASSTGTNLFNVLGSGNVGIGTSSPLNKLTVAGNILTTDVIQSTGCANPGGSGSIELCLFSGAGYVQAYNRSNATWMPMNVKGSTIDFVADNATVMSLASSLITVSADMEVNGIFSATSDVYFNNLGVSSGGTAVCTSGGWIYDAGGDTCSSSMRALKHDISDLQVNALSTIAAMKPAVFTYNTGVYPNKKGPQWGFIADDLAQVATQLVEYDQNGNLNQLNMPALISINTKGIQDLSKILGVMEVSSTTGSSTYVSRLDTIESRITALENALASSTASSTLAVASSTSSSTAQIVNASMMDSIAASLASMQEWVGQKITATYGVFENLTVGSSAKPSGITLFDKVTSSPYCVQVVNGQVTNVPGDCQALAAAAAATVSASTSSTSSTTSTGDVTITTDTSTTTSTSTDTTAVTTTDITTTTNTSTTTETSSAPVVTETPAPVPVASDSASTTTP